MAILSFQEDSRLIQVCLLGCGGTMPLPDRYLTALLLRLKGHSLLVDCGEGTQVAMRAHHQSIYAIDTILFTHYHADHISGLPGLLLSMGLAGRTQPVELIGPAGLENIVRCLRCIAPELPFPLIITELSQKEQTLERMGLTIEAFALEHSISCYGYSFFLPRAGKFDIARALAARVPQIYWKQLQKGETIQEDGVLYRPEDVLGPARPGIKLVYATDTRPTAVLEKHVSGAHLFIGEGMFGDPEKLKDAIEKKHSLFSETAQIARRAQPERLWLTHLSVAIEDPEIYLPETQAIFPAAEIGTDGKSIELNYPDA